MKCRNIEHNSLVWFGLCVSQNPITIADGSPSAFGSNIRQFSVEQFRNLTNITLDRNVKIGFDVESTSEIFYPTILLTNTSGVSSLLIEGQATTDKQTLLLEIPDSPIYATKNLQSISIYFGAISGSNSVPNGYKVKLHTDNYVSDTDAVVASLTQRLSVLKGELWYQVNYGLPLTDKIRSTKIFDAVICDIITSHPGVTGIVNFSSSIENHTYRFNAEILTIYGDQAVLQNSYST